MQRGLPDQMRLTRDIKRTQTPQTDGYLNQHTRSRTTIVHIMNVWPNCGAFFEVFHLKSLIRAVLTMILKQN